MAKYRFEQIAINSTEKKKPVEEDRFTYLGLEHLDSGSLKVTRFGSEVAPIGEKLVMRKGDVLFGKRRAYQKKVAIAPFDGIFSAHGMVLRPNEDVIDPDFFPLFISSNYFLDAAIKISVGSLSPTINWRDLKVLEFELPNLETQRKLAAVLWSINDTMESYKKLISATDELVKSQFMEQFFYSEKYQLVPISSVVDRKIKKKKDISKDFEEIRYIDISSINNQSKRVTGYVEFPIDETPSRAQQVLEKGDILISTVRPNLQNIAVNPYSEENVVASTGFCVLRCKKCLPEYIWGVITSEAFTNAMCEQASGISYPAVRDSDILQYLIPDAPIEIQEQFAAFVRQSDKSKFAALRSSNLNLSRCLVSPERTHMNGD